MIQYWKFVQNITLTESAYLKKSSENNSRNSMFENVILSNGNGNRNDAAEKTERIVPFGPETRPYQECETYQTTATVHLHSSKAVCTPNIPEYSLSTYSGFVHIFRRNNCSTNDVLFYKTECAYSYA